MASAPCYAWRPTSVGERGRRGRCPRASMATRVFISWPRRQHRRHSARHAIARLGDEIRTCDFGRRDGIARPPIVRRLVCLGPLRRGSSRQGRGNDADRRPAGPIRQSLAARAQADKRALTRAVRSTIGQAFMAKTCVVLRLSSIAPSLHLAGAGKEALNGDVVAGTSFRCAGQKRGKGRHWDRAALDLTSGLAKARSSSACLAGRLIAHYSLRVRRP